MTDQLTFLGAGDLSYPVVEREVGWTLRGGGRRLFWQYSVPIARLTNEQRLAQAIDAARMRPGVKVDVVYVHPATAAATIAPDGVTLVAERGLRERFDFRFEREA